LAKDPSDRYRDGAELAEALRAAEPAESLSPSSGATAVLSRPKAPSAVRPRPAPRTATRVGAAYSPRRVVNPSERRQRRALFAGVLLLAAGLVAGAIALLPGNVKVPQLHGLSRARVDAKLRHAGLRATFTHRYSGARAGTAVAEAPRAGTQIKDGSTVRVVLSAGPAPVPVPDLVNGSSASAQAALARAKLRAHLVQVPAPGVSPGTVVRQSPAAGARLAPGSKVTLSVAEVPRWRTLTSFTGNRSVPFRIRGARWQLVYSMGYQGTCTFIFICQGPTATVTNLTTGAKVEQFDLGDGSGQVKSFSTGAGVYQVSVSPGSDTAHWSLRAEDYY
jgi:hypothetical protein